jgi:peptide subunit release factor 1 (eRF1)
MVDSNNKVTSLESILNYIPTGKSVVSVYLLVDRSRVAKKGYQTKLNSMITSSKEKLEADTNFDRSQKREIFEIFERVKSFVSDKFRADSTRTLAIFSSGDGLWEEFRIPIIMRSKIIIDPKPYTQNIRSLISNSKRYGVLLIDREKAQIYSVYLGVVNEYLAAFISDVPSKVNFRSQAAFREKKLLGRLEEKLHHFFKLVNDKTMELFKEKKFDYLILAGRKEIIPNFSNYLHSYLQSRCIGNIDAKPDSKISLISKKARKVIDEFEIKNKNDLVDRLIDEYNPNGMGVLGIDATIKSLLIEQIKILIYDRQFTHNGYICSSCRYLTIEYKDKCPYCGGEPVFYNDIVDEIVEDALNQGCEIVDIEGNKKLLRAGNIGAVLRYKL